MTTVPVGSKGGQQRGEGGDLGGLVWHGQLGDHLAVAGQRGEQVDGVGGLGARAAGGLAVDGHGDGAGRGGAE
ncbi:hypothetical protein [Streptomyces sp. NPDC094147]|uniref:hypothetical protein n=1 Tax=Streptomyces sp. NPDC094147 TaxID=3366057 RepID=UPI003804A453